MITAKTMRTYVSQFSPKSSSIKTPKVSPATPVYGELFVPHARSRANVTDDVDGIKFNQRLLQMPPLELEL